MGMTPGTKGPKIAGVVFRQYLWPAVSPHQNWTLYLKMAVKMNVDEVLSLFRDDEEGEERVEVDQSENYNRQEDDVGRLKDWVSTFKDGGEGFNQPLFARAAENLLLPLLEACRKKEERPEIVSVLVASNINAAVVLKRESILWLAGIRRKLAGRL